MYIRYFILYILLSVSFFSAICQEQPKLIQFSGGVVTADSLRPIPFTHIYIKGSSRGTISDFHGFFSFVAKPNDTIFFSALGYKKASYVIPDTLKKEQYTMFQVMQVDTIYLSETVIYPWPTPSQFKQAFLSLHIPDDDYERAKKNIAMMGLKDNFMYITMDGSLNYKQHIQKQISNYYTLGQFPQNNLFNPMAWGAFFKAWQNGEFKKHNKEINKTYPPDYE